MSVISVDHLTKDYGHGRGVFDVNIRIDTGTCYGFLGPNGAGKTTTICHMMGFSRPQEGSTSILGKDSWENSAWLQNTVGYLPGEVTLPAGLSGTAFLRMMEQMRGVKNHEYLNMLLNRFELDPNISIKQMSLGVKRKLAVVTAFMHHCSLSDDGRHDLCGKSERFHFGFYGLYRRADGFLQLSVCAGVV
ncbi:MAG: ATP-binding cassette domain-containing protein [Lachnospiraceae bacterium]|nr:ATP-binding cassette domain-containing protein [Lachnospiraceae bacterium]